MSSKEKIHFIGIGGAGMSGLAEVLHRQGYKVQGSDIKKTKVTDRLEALGISVKEPHSAGNVNDADCVVYSSCIKKDNPELEEAARRDIPVLHRMEALKTFMKDKDLIAVSGAHGKTTTTSLISFLLIEAGLDPTVFIGADVDFLKGNARYGRSALVVTEADESDGSFLLLRPKYSVATNIDKEHMDHYSSMDNMISSYEIFIDNTASSGCAFLCSDDIFLRRIAENKGRKIVKYGLSDGADISADNIELRGLDGSSFDLLFNGKRLDRLKISLLGMHNILNSLAAIGVAMRVGVDLSLIKELIRDFKGIDRRFIITRLNSDILVIDDYAHHPTEIKATLKVLEDSGKRIVAVFQPHRYSRTRYLKEEFGSAFGLSDHLVITDIYSAHEVPIDGVSAKDIYESAKRFGHKNVHFVPKNDIIKHLTQVVRPGDAVFILGAGDIGELPEKVVKALTKMEISH